MYCQIKCYASLTPPIPDPNSFQLRYINVFSLEPHESLNEDIIIASGDESDATDKDKKEELVIYVIFFFPSFIFLLNNESHSVQTWKTVLFLVGFFINYYSETTDFMLYYLGNRYHTFIMLGMLSIKQRFQCMFVPLVVIHNVLQGVHVYFL